MERKQSDLNYLKLCLKLAKLSIKKGNHPFGAILVFKNHIVATSENKVISLNDITAHAELLLIQQAQKILTKSEIAQSTIYTSTEPCSMCSGAIYWSGLKHVVYGVSNKHLSQIVGGSLEISCKEIFRKGTRNIKVDGYDQYIEFSNIHKNFW